MHVTLLFSATGKKWKLVTVHIFLYNLPLKVLYRNPVYPVDSVLNFAFGFFIYWSVFQGTLPLKHYFKSYISSIQLLPVLLLQYLI